MANTLYEHFTSQGKALPGIAERGDLYTRYGLGSSYSGTANENNRLLHALTSSGYALTAPKTTAPVNPTSVTPQLGTATTIQNKSTTGGAQTPTPTNTGNMYSSVKLDTNGNPVNAGGAAANAGISGTTNTPTGPLHGSVESLFAGMGETEEEKANRRMIEDSLSTWNTPIDEEAIRAKTLADFQAQIDATKSVYADKLNQARVQGQGRLGSGRALRAGAGMLGSARGAAITENIQGYNTEIEDSVRAEENAIIQRILSQARSDASGEIAAKRAAKEAGGKAYLEHLSKATEYKTDRTRKMALALLQGNLTPDKITDEQLKAYNISRADLTMMYNEGKSQMDAQKAQAEADRVKTELEASKTRSEISHNEARTIAEMVKAGEMREEGGRVYQPVQDANGNITWKYIADARSIQQSLSGGGVGGGVANAGNMVTTRLNNGQTITIGQNVANALQNVTSIIPGIKFDTQNATRTADDQARLYGKGRTAAELQAAGVNPAYAQPGAPQVTWTLQSNHMTGNAVDVVGDQNYLNSIEKQMNAAGFVRPKETMARGDYGHFEYQGGVAGLSDLAQSVQKGIITIAQIPAAQRSQVAAELARAGQNSPKSVELQNSISLVDTMLQDENALKSISGWWGGRIPGTGVFGNQLALNQFNQLKGILSIGEREKLKGSGAISDFESKMLAQSASALGRNLSEADFKAELEKIRDILSGKYKYLTTDVNVSPTVPINTPTGNTGTGTGEVVNGAI